MSGAGIRIEVSDALVAQGLAALAARLADLTPVMDEIGGYIETSTVQRFEDQAGPDDNPWPQSLRAKMQGGQTLVDTGRLRASLTHTAAADRVEVGTNVIYAAVHQFGAVIKAKQAGHVLQKGLMFQLPDGTWIKTRQVTIPARPYLGINDEDRDEITHILADWLAGPAAGAVA